ncbi:MAG: stage II sporulation protein P [Christensenellaceae bacterium]|nr:stage II sporulation protein P [Christensenellaceae bacterium]
MKRGLICLLILCLMLPLAALAEGEEQVWELVTEDGRVLTQLTYEPETGDEYLAGDNTLYVVVRVEGNRAVAQSQGMVALPDVAWLDSDAALAVSAMGDKRIAMYCTHSDESYEPSDGTYSSNDRGSIYEIAEALAAALEEDGVSATVADTLHHPHDSGAYRRSRQTAVELLRETAPDALLDIHRDGIPDPEQYQTTIGGRECSKIRLLVGRGNQNMEVNKDFALTVKAVADKLYPGLIKDIYMGKGVFNQDLLPKSVLLECGTYTLEKELVMRSMPLMADVLYRTLYGGVTGSAGTVSDSRSSGQNRASNDGITPGATDVPVNAEGNDGSMTGILWVVGLFIVGIIVYGVLAAGSMRSGVRKAGRHLSEMTGGLIGKKPEEGENPEHSGKEE